MASPALRRRDLVTGLAWTVPAVVVIGAAPAIAASLACPGGSATGAITQGGLDRWTLLNTGPVAWPAGTTITWTLQNRLAAADTFAVRRTSGLTPASQPGVTLASGATVTWSFVTSAPVDPNTSVAVQMASDGYTYDSTFVVSFAGTVLSSCPTLRLCASNVWNLFGATCATAAALRAAADPAPGAGKQAADRQAAGSTSAAVDRPPRLPTAR